jgi:hypothetical protein
MYYLFIENEKINGGGQCKCLNENIKNIEVNENIYNQYIAEPIRYTFSNEKIIENPNYESEKQKEYITNQILEIQRKLDILDTKRIRAVCEDEIRDERTGETWLDYYNSQIYDLRVELKSLENQL